MVRAPFYDKSGLKKGEWSPEEDDKLITFIQRYGHSNWRHLPRFAGLSRCGKSCRLRWMNYLRPDVKRGNYSKEENDLIIKLHEEVGNKWSVIATNLPGRSDNEIKNHWHTHLKKRVKKHPTTCEVQKQPTEASAGIKTKESSQAGNLQSTVPLHDQMSERFPLSPETSSSEFSTLSCEDLLVSGIKWTAEETLASFEELSGNFWTEPFVTDKNEYPITPYVPYYDDGLNLFDQVMQELPENCPTIYYL